MKGVVNFISADAKIKTAKISSKNILALCKKICTCTCDYTVYGCLHLLTKYSCGLKNQRYHGILLPHSISLLCSTIVLGSLVPR